MGVNFIKSFPGLPAVTVLGTAPALALHGWSGYDSSKPLARAGTITEVSYTCPHATIKMEVSGKTWRAERIALAGRADGRRR
jgi:hypothetical protein